MKKLVLAVGCFGLLVAIGIPMNAAAGDAKKGKMVFEDNCSACHNADSTEDEGWAGAEGPVQTQREARDREAGQRNDGESSIRSITAAIHDASALGDALKPADKDNVIAYLKTL